MSAESSLVTAAHFAYIAERTARDDDLLVELKREAAAAGIPAIHVAPEQASFMRILLHIAGARQVVEVGTLAGYSAISMARALPPGGRVRTIEIDPVRATFARRWVARSDVAGRVEVLCGDGAELLAGFEDLSADAAFLDADKESYPRYLRECLRIVRPGGLIAADNALAFGQLFHEHPTDASVPAVRAFNELVPATAGLQGVIVPLGDGLWVCVKE